MFSLPLRMARGAGAIGAERNTGPRAAAAPLPGAWTCLYERLGASAGGPARGLNVVEQSRRRTVAAPKGADRGSQGPSGPQPTADLEEIIRRVQEALGKLTSSGGSASGGSGKGAFTGRTSLFLILGAVLVWFAWGTFYSVQPNEVGINLVFGRYTGKTAAGLNTNWPWPIGSVIKVPVWDQQITEVGYRSLGGSTDIPEESQMLTGDKNIVDVHFRVNWQIDPAKPEDYVFNILNPRETVKAVAESIMREVVGLKTIDGILTTDRASVEADVQKRMQDLCSTHIGLAFS